MRLLVVVATDKEADALGCTKAQVCVSGIGRTNAAAATTAALLEEGPFDGVISVGIAGALPGSMLRPGEIVVATKCVYVEEGLRTPQGFQDTAAMGFPLGDFEGNRVPCEARLTRFVPGPRHDGVIATVAAPSPDDPPVTMAERPERLISMFPPKPEPRARRSPSVPRPPPEGPSPVRSRNRRDVRSYQRLSAVGSGIEMAAGIEGTDLVLFQPGDDVWVPEPRNLCELLRRDRGEAEGRRG